MGEVAVQRQRPAGNAYSDPAYPAGALPGPEGLGSDNDYAKLKRLQARLEYVFSL